MKLENYLCVKCLELPIDWEEVVPNDQFPPRMMRSFSPSDNLAVRITVFYRGVPVTDKSTKIFRQILKSEPRSIYNDTNKIDCDTKLISELADILGNMGNNQITNTEVGFLGPSFNLERLDTLIWNSKSILAARGRFQDPETSEDVSFFSGFFIDSDQYAKESSVVEIFLEAEDEKDYLQYLPQFEESLHSIEWTAS